MAGTAAARRHRRRRRLVVAATVVVVVAAGAGTAYALDGSDGPRYRFATAARGTVTQTVDADGSLAAEQVVTPAFASAGTVTRVGVAVGDTVTAGQTLATIGTSGLTEAVTSAETALAQAQEKLTDDEDGTSTTSTTGNGTGGSGASTGSATGTATGTTTATTTSATTGTRTTSSAGATLLSDTTSATSATVSAAAPSTGTTKTGTTKTGTATGATKTGTTKTGTATGATSVEALRATVATDAAALVAAVHAQTTAIATACAPATEKDGSVVTASPAADGSISGAVGSQAALVTLEQDGAVLHTANAGSPVAAGDSYSFTGLTAGATYTVRIVRMAVIDTATCTTAITDAQATDSSVATASATFSRDLTALQKALATIGTGTGGTGTGGTGTGAGTTGSTRSGTTQAGGTQSAGSQSGTQSTGTTTTTVTAEQIVADQAAVTAAQADVTLAKKNLGNATLTSPITGTVAAVGIAKGDAVSASSSTQTITVIGHDALSVELDIPLTKIDLVKAGQTASVTVDGLTTPVAAKVTYVGSLNSASSTGSSSSYPVTVQLDKESSTLYDGMGAEVSIAVGSGTSAVTVPLSAVTTVGTRSVVSVYSGGKVTATSVTLGLVGTDTVQVTKGLTAGQRIVLADLDAAVPSSTTTTTRRGTGTGTFGGLTGGTGTGTFGGGAGGFGGPPGGR